MGAAAGIIGALISAATSVAPRLLGDKDAIESNAHDEQMAVLEQFAKEFINQQNRTWWDAFIDGVNRLPRPVFALGVLGLFAYAMIDPIGFSAIMAGLATVPEWLAVMMGGIVMFYFGARTLEKWNGRMSGPSAQQVADAVAAQDKILAIRDARKDAQAWREEAGKLTAEIEAEALPDADDAAQADAANQGELASIQAWKASRGR